MKGMVRNSPGLDIQGTHITVKNLELLQKEHGSTWAFTGFSVLAQVIKEGSSRSLDFLSNCTFLLTLSLPSFIMTPKASMSCSLEGCLHTTGIRNKPVWRIFVK